MPPHFFTNSEDRNEGLEYDLVPGRGCRSFFTMLRKAIRGRIPSRWMHLSKVVWTARGDRHVLVLDDENCMLYELYDAAPEPDGSQDAGSGAIFDLSSHALRPDGWTSADAAGLPILPGLVRYEEVRDGEVAHAIRFTSPITRREYVWPAWHYASVYTDEVFPPMGQQFRLKAGFDISGFFPGHPGDIEGHETYLHLYFEPSYHAIQLVCQIT